MPLRDQSFQSRARCSLVCSILINDSLLAAGRMRVSASLFLEEGQRLATYSCGEPM
jgi:hypothetical protein